MTGRIDLEERLRCCHVLRDRSSAFLVASATLRPHSESALFTVSFVPA
jgi:hypothetical protein